MSFSSAPFSAVPFSALDSESTGKTFRLLAPGRNPRLILDFGGGCLRRELQLFAMEPGAGMQRRPELQRFNTRIATPLEDETNLAIENVIRSVDRRVTVLYSVRDPDAGTYELKRLDSIPYPFYKEPPSAPSFLFSNPASLTFDRGGLWADGGGVTETRSLLCTVGAIGTTHAVELQCSSYFPFGYEPEFPDQHLEYNAGGAVLGPGTVAGFDVELTHGGGLMSPCAFRIRSRDDTDPEAPCYSTWRYYLAGYYDPTMDGPDVTPSDFDVVVCNPADYSAFAGGSVVRMVYDTFFIGTRLSANCVLAAARFPSGVFTVFHDWTTTGRGKMNVRFQDEDGQGFNFELLSILSTSSGEGAATVSLPLDQVPLQFGGNPVLP